MAYIGRPLNAGNLAVMSAVGNGSSTTPIATLDYATTTNGIAVYLDGVRQLPSVDYNVTAQTTLTFTTAPANGVGVDVYFLGLEVSIPTPADGTVTTAKIADVNVTTGKLADNSVTLAKMAGGTDGQVITYDASGDPVAVGPGTDGQVLTSTGAGSPPAFEDASGGAWTLINSSVASNSASITITGLSTTYSTFSIHLQGMKSSASSRTLYMRIGNSSGIVSTGYNYDSHVQVLHENTPPNYYANISQNLASSNAGFQIGYAAGWSDSSGFLNAVLYLQRGSTTSDNNPMMHGTYSMHSSGTGDMAGGACCYRYANALITDMDRIEFYNSSGDIALGRISVFGIAHA